MLLRAADGTECVTRARQGVAFAMDEAFDLESYLDVAPTIEALASATLARLELRELRLPETQDISFDFADASYVANFEIETVRNSRLFVDALGG